MSASDFAAMIADLRMRLLDLRNSNKLLSYKHAERGKTHVRIVDELPDLLAKHMGSGSALYFRSLPEPENELPDEKTDDFLMLLEEERSLDQNWLELLGEDEDINSGRALKIDRAIRDRVRAKLDLPPAKGGKLTSVAEWARMNGIEPSFDLPLPSDEPDGKHADEEIQTLLLPDELQAKMAGVMDHTRTALQESGVNILHLAIGFLEWFESPSSEKPLLAPLLLYPVELQRKALKAKGLYRYAIVGSEQEPIVNITLRERLNRDFGLIIPDFFEGDTPETYCARVAETISGKTRWRIRRFATLGLFSFSRLVMYNDLDPARWGGEERMLQLGVLSQLFGRKDGTELSPEEHDIDDPAVENEVPLLIRDADSSQHQAIIDVMRGKNLVVKGPPGTGKSQTIANLIAASLAKGKTVLFAAEKAAALDVVKKRLDDAGLGHFCFELHSTKAKKADVLASLDRRLKFKASFQTSVIDGALNEAYSLRNQLTQHAVTMNLPFGSLEICDPSGQWRRATVHDVLWAEQRVRARPPRFMGLDRVHFDDCMETTRFDVKRRRDRLSNIEGMAKHFVDAYGGPDLHPWHMVSRTDIAVLSVDEIAEAAHDTAQSLIDLEVWLDHGAIPFKRGDLPSTLAELHALASTLAEVPEPGPIARDDVFRACLRSPATVASLESLLSRIEKRGQLLQSLARYVGDTARPLDGAAVRIQVELAATANAAADLPVSEIGPLAARIRNDIASFRKVADYARELLGLFGLHNHLVTPKVLRRIVEAIELLRGADRAALLNRIPSVLDETVRPLLERAAQRQAELRAAESALRQTAVLDASLSVLELRRHATTLRTSGFFGRLGADYKLARQVFLSIAKDPGRGDGEEMADLLITVADHLEARRVFETDQALHSVCLHKFAGLDTDLDTLLAAHHLAARFRSTFAGIAEPERSIRRMLLEADVETLDGIAFCGADPRYAQLRNVIFQAGTRDDCDLLTFTEASEARATALEQVHTALARMGFRPTTSLRKAVEATELQAQILEIEQSIAVDEMTRLAAGGGSWTDVNIESIRAALAAAAAILASDPPPLILSTLIELNAPVVETIRHIKTAGDEIIRRGRALAQALCLLADRIMVDPDAEMATLWSPAELTELSHTLREAAGARGELVQWVEWRRALADAREDGLSPILDAYCDAGEPFDGLADSYDRVFYRSLVRRLVQAHPGIGAIQGRSLSEIRQSFCDLDVRIMEMRRQKLVAELADRRIPPGVQSVRKSECTDACLIENEIAKRKKHIPIRNLIDRAADAIVAMKPCVMMSPASVAQYLKPRITFDLVIIDEASQMRPEEAIGALIRARQAVVVGDPQQLPPSAFFERQEADGGAEGEEEIEKIAAESILDFARSAFRPERELLWHYRSRHGSLIAFSNNHFYDNRLIVFPSPQEGHADYGVRLVNVDGQYRASVNVPEAQAVAEAALEFMLANPDKSLGIVALNQPHRDLILQEMDRMFIRNAAAERYRVHWESTLEPFFVKNLENVQGDERDMIFISTVYGPDENGKVYQRFGPINGAAGDRRLNVLFSRAKHGVTVFSSLRADQIRVDATTPRGTALLKAYLEFAATGRLHAGHMLHRECDSDFERFVKEKLEARGYEVVAQVGVAGFRIDLGVRHPEWQHGFLLGIECDGATYHSSLSARDRDRLRQQILESLGWTIYRIWSTDWFRDPTREAAKLYDFVEATLADAKARLTVARPLVIELPDIDENENFVKVANPHEEDSADDVDEEDNGIGREDGTGGPLLENISSPSRTAAPIAGGAYIEADLKGFKGLINADAFYDRAYDGVLMQMVRHVVAVEGPIRGDVLARRIALAHGFQRTGGRIHERINALASKAFSVTRDGEHLFVWPEGVTASQWTMFRPPSGEARSVDEISMPELRALAQRVRTEGLEGDDAIVAMARIAGLQRLRTPSRERLTHAWQASLGTETVGG